MRAVVQRVLAASVEVEGVVTGEIGDGILVLVGVEEGDQETDIDYIAGKLVSLRIFDDDDGKLNLSVKDVDGKVLIVSQFTLLGDARRGKRPSYIAAARPEKGKEYYEKLCAKVAALDVAVERGIFQADMRVSLVNDGPVTILLDSKKVF